MGSFHSPRPDAAQAHDFPREYNDELNGSFFSKMRAFLQQCIRQMSTSGLEGPFSSFVRHWATQQGFATDLWETDEDALRHWPQGHARHLPLKGRPTLVIKLPGHGGGRTLLFNAHADVVSAPDPERWQYNPWSGQDAQGRIWGRGACDDKGPLVSALWAMARLKQQYPEGLAGDVLLELVPGEEDSVGIGTLTSLLRGYRGDAVVVLEPTEGLPRCASRGGCRFEVTCLGQAVHGTVKWLGQDALAAMRVALDALDDLEKQWNDRDADPLFAPYPIVRPVTVDRVDGGHWQGMVADHCLLAGYLELLPGDDIPQWQQRFTDELRMQVNQRGIDANRIRVAFTEEYPGHRTSPEDPVCRLAQQIVEDPPQDGWSGWAAFNSGCESGLRATIQHSPTLIWGPGSLAQAHRTDEYVEWSQVQQVAKLLERFALQWCS